MTRRASRIPGDARGLWWAGGLLGFALSGFFDGILLHQVLQWHHLLSGLESVASLERLVLWDGLFHILMYLVGLLGLGILWRERRATAQPGAGRALLASALIGFGLWHLLDAVVSHWLLGIHRIRMDSEMPLLWDLVWLFLFGILFLYLGWRTASARRPPDSSGGRAIGFCLVTAALITGPLAALPPPDSTTIVLFKAGTSPLQVFAALDAVGGDLVWSNAEGTLWAFDLVEDAPASVFYQHGALLVSGGFLAAACLNWTRS